MADDLPHNVKLVAVAILRAGGRATLPRIYAGVRELNPEWVAQYRSDESFMGTVRSTIEEYCPQSEKFKLNNPAFFERLDAGEYRVISSEEREAAERRGRRLDD
jgi:predicted DNA-binding protein